MFTCTEFTCNSIFLFFFSPFVCPVHAIRRAQNLYFSSIIMENGRKVFGFLYRKQFGYFQNEFDNKDPDNSAILCNENATET